MKLPSLKKINFKTVKLISLITCSVFLGAAIIFNLAVPQVHGAANVWNLIRDGSSNLVFQWSTPTTDNPPIVTISPSKKMDVKGILAVNGGNLAGTSSNLTPGALNIGDFGKDYGGGQGWNTSVAGLFLEAKDNTEIAVHDAETRLASLMFYEGGLSNNRITIGRDMGWGPISRVDINGVLKLNPATAAPNWNTNSYMWMQAGVGSRYDGYQHIFDAGAARKTAMVVNPASDIQVNNKLTVGIDHWGVEQMNYPAITTYGGMAVFGHSYHVGGLTIGEWAVHNGTALWVNGPASRADNLSTWTVSSDANLKKNIQTLDNSLDKILQLRGVSFEWKDPSKFKNQTGPQMGLVAQEVEKVFPQWVGTDAEGFKSLSISGFEGLTIEALRELNNKLTTQLEVEKKRNDAQDAQISQLKQQLEELKAK